ncbi:agamous-like MADS-box protein AGL62 [Argentina anserina]|uniref:agamous-like MADS-box protein AGL62 n=1 Tax=Argentina anserina TaxID=57926 RepID=UPI0021766ACA|nr:agamous-like MADS-box protein AGL62 [Potentilla anserina]
MATRVNKGRQKIEMRRIKKDSNRQVAFSKRRSGVFKKASELCILTGAEIAVIVSSPGRRAFSFGYPCVQAIIDRYENMNSPIPDNDNTDQLMEVARRRQVDDLTMELAAIKEEIEKEKMKGERLNQEQMTREAQDWYKRFIDKTNDEEQLNFYGNMLRELSGKVTKESEVLRQKQVELLLQDAAMTTTRAFRDFMHSRAPATWPTYEGNSSSHNAMNPQGPMSHPPPLPPHAGP